MLSKTTVDEAEERVACPIRAACLVMSPDLERRGPWSGGPWSVLVLTTDELCAFSMRPAGWRRPNTSLLDTELMRVPLSAVDRLDRRPSINPMVKVFRLTFTDGRRMTVQVGRGSWNRYGDVIELFRTAVTRR
jgi:hypothetical protein